MTLKFMQGWETCRDDSDARVQGWLNAPVKAQMAFGPSLSGLAGTSMRPIGSYSTSSSTVAPGGSGVTDYGYYNTGITVNQAWLAGGFAWGFGARFNSGVSASYGAGAFTNIGYTGNNTNSACFDGTRYWAIQLIGSTYTVVYTTDFITWTAAPVQPVTLNAGTSISHVGSGVIVLIGSTTSSTALTIWYTSNQGLSWSSQNLGTANAAGTQVGNAIATGNATYPHAVYVGTNATNTGSGALFVGTIGGTMTQVLTTTGSTGGWANNAFRSKIVGGLICINTCQNGVSSYFIAPSSASNLNAAAAWTTITFGAGTPVLTDITYSAVSNMWIVSTTQGTGQGIATFANPGTPGTANQPTGVQTLTNRYSTVGMSSVWTVGSTVVAVGSYGHIITSADGGITWTESGGHILPVGTATIGWNGTFFDGTQYVLFSDNTTGVIATSPDLQTNFTVKYVREGTEYSITNDTAAYTGIAGAAAAPVSGGTWSNNANICYLNVSTASGGARTVGLSFANGNQLATASISTSSLYHYWEIVATATATGNTFNISWYCDGALQGTVTNQLCATSTSDTTTLMILTFTRMATFTAYDDMYFNLIDGVGLSGQLGPVNIVAARPSTDVQAQWVKNGSASSNSLSVNQPAYSSQSANYVSSGNAGDKDIYTSPNVIPSNYTVKAVAAEAVFTRTSTSAPTVNVGIQSSATESDSAAASLTSSNPTFVQGIFQKDPNGNVAWTNANAAAIKTVLNHTV